MEARIIFHIDFDYFYAQCEEVRRPGLRTKPVCVCMFSERGSDSGAIATANYAAREFGVKSGIPIFSAKKLLEGRADAVFLSADFEHYTDISEKAMNIMREFADIFEYVGRDEAYLDVSRRTGQDYDRAGNLAQQIKNSIKSRLKLSCSVGVSPNKLLSKIASAHRKPDGLTMVLPGRIGGFLDSLSVRVIPGIGRKTEERLSQMGMQTIADLKKLDIFTLNREFGRKTAAYIFNAARGANDDPVREKEPSTQYSKITTLKRDSKEYDFLLETAMSLCESLYHTLQKNKKTFRSVGIQFVQSDMSNKTKSRLLKNHASSLEDLQKSTRHLLKSALEDQSKNVRRLGVRVSELSEMRGQGDITSYF